MSSGPPRQLQNLSHKGSGHNAVRSTNQSSRIASAEAVSFSVNFNNQRPPEKSYTTETAFVEYKNGEVFFIFAQHELIGSRLESAISLKMHGFWAKQFLRSIVSIANPSIEEISNDLGIKQDPLGVIDHNPGHTAKLSANIVQAAVAGHETCLDFYHLTPFASLKAQSSKKDSAELIGIVRVDLRTALFLSIIEKLKTLDSSFPDAPKNNLLNEARHG